MNKNKLILTILTGVLFAAAANSRADVDVTITGSTAFRNVVWDRVYSLFDGGIPGTTIKGTTVTDGSKGQATVNGTMTSLFGAGVPVHIRYSFNGSVSGLQAVNQAAPIETFDPFTGNKSNVVADIAFADNFPNSCTPPIPAGNFVSDDQLGVVVFTFIKNAAPGLAGVNNMTKELAWSLFSSGGTLPAGYLPGGSGTDPVYLIGRDNGSGTRVTVTKDLSYGSGLSQYGTNAAGQLVTASSLAVPGTSPIASLGTNSPTGVFAGKDGYDSGSFVVNVLKTAGLSSANLIGYAGLKDADTTGVTMINYQGVTANTTNVNGLLVNVANGTYPLWGYEHASYKSSQSDANKIAFFNALVAAIKDPSYQTTNPQYSKYNVPLSSMVFSRGSVDGGSYTAGPAF